MHTQSSDKELLYSIPIEVEFAGFRSDTLKLALAGWDLSMQQIMDPREYGPSLRLALRHEGAKLYALSDNHRLEYGQVHAARRNVVEYAQFLSQMCFRISYCAPDIRFASVAMRYSGSAASFGSSFNAIDPFPQERTVEESIKDFKFFKIANPSIKDIIVSPDQVPELLDLVLRTQKITLDQVRAREKSRANTEWVRGEMSGTKPAHKVQMQIITLAS